MEAFPLTNIVSTGGNLDQMHIVARTPVQRFFFIYGKKKKSSDKEHKSTSGYQFSNVPLGSEVTLS